MVYDVVLTSQAQLQFKQILGYLIYRLKNKQAAVNLTNDFDETVVRLSCTANALKVCDNAALQSKEYRTIRFRRHRYLMVYHIDGETVYVDGIYHELQDYENIL